MNEETMPDGSVPTNLAMERKTGTGPISYFQANTKSKLQWEEENTLAGVSIVGYLEGKMKFRIKNAEDSKFSLESTSSLGMTYFKTTKGAKIAASRSLNKKGK